jgi:hypothetical protein
MLSNALWKYRIKVADTDNTDLVIKLGKMAVTV